MNCENNIALIAGEHRLTGFELFRLIYMDQGSLLSVMFLSKYAN